MRALALSGGGARIHYHVGVIRHLVGVLGIEYDIFTGVSSGALAAAFLAQYPKGQEFESAVDLEDLTIDLREEDVRHRWRPLGVLHGLWKPSFFRSAPLRQLVERELSVNAIESSGKKLRIGAVCVTSGELRLFHEDSPDLHRAVLASAAFPAILEPVAMDGRLWIDGGVRVMTPIKAAIDAGADQIDVVITSPKDMGPAASPTSLNALQVAARAVNFMIDEIVEKDVKLAERTNDMVDLGADTKYRKVEIQVIRPESRLGDAFDFSTEHAERARAAGLSDAKKAFPLDFGE